MAETRFARVVMWDFSAGWGVVEDRLGEQYLCGANAVEGGRLSVGQIVQFRSTMADNGNLLAVDVRPAKPRVPA